MTIRRKKKFGRNPRLVDYFNEQSGICAYCHEDMTLDLGYDATATIDHVEPTSKGGPKRKFNEIACCSSCNSVKSDMPVVEFLRFFAHKIGEEKKTQEQMEFKL